jgi:ribosomal protein S18 acetylase RimI-like enzyme
MNLSQDFEKIIKLYDNVGWSAYTENPTNLKKALENSTYLFGYFEDENLMGIIRGLTDLISIHFIQDIIVQTNSHGNGIGTKLVEHVSEIYKDVRATVLLTDDDPSQIGFYKKLKFSNTRELEKIPLNTFVKYKDLELS